MTLVLVHGAWSGAWSWKGVATILRARGYEVYVPTLTGLAERAHTPPQNVSLDTHVSDIAGLLHYEDLHDVVLVGHSYGGMVITGAADRARERVAGMIYLDAFVPTNGQSLWDIVGPEAAAVQRRAAEAYDGGHSLERPRATPVMSQEFVDRWGSRFTPQPVRTMSEPFVSVRAEQTWPPRHFVLCTRYAGSVFHGVAAKLRGREGWSYGELDALHDVLRTDPDITADAIDATARAWRSQGLVAGTGG